MASHLPVRETRTACDGPTWTSILRCICIAAHRVASLNALPKILRAHGYLAPLRAALHKNKLPHERNARRIKLRISPNTPPPPPLLPKHGRRDRRLSVGHSRRRMLRPVFSFRLFACVRLCVVFPLIQVLRTWRRKSLKRGGDREEWSTAFHLGSNGSRRLISGDHGRPCLGVSDQSTIQYVLCDTCGLLPSS